VCQVYCLYKTRHVPQRLPHPVRRHRRQNEVYASALFSPVRGLSLRRVKNSPAANSDPCTVRYGVCGGFGLGRKNARERSSSRLLGARCFRSSQGDWRISRRAAPSAQSGGYARCRRAGRRRGRGLPEHSRPGSHLELRDGIARCMCGGSSNPLPSKPAPRHWNARRASAGIFLGAAVGAPPCYARLCFARHLIGAFFLFLLLPDCRRLSRPGVRRTQVS